MYVKVEKNYQIDQYTGGNQRGYLAALKVVQSFRNCSFQYSYFFDTSR